VMQHRQLVRQYRERACLCAHCHTEAAFSLSDGTS
jgi:hypothetical protein